MPKDDKRGLFGVSQNVWRGIQGMGEGFAGRGSQWQAAQARQAESEAYRQRLEADRKAKFQELLTSAYARDMYQVSQLLGGENPRPDLVPGLIEQNVALSEQMGLPVPQAVQQMRELANAGDFEGLRAFADTGVQSAAADGLLEIPGQGGDSARTQFGETGRLIQMPDGSFARSIPKMNPSTGEVEEVVVPLAGTPVNNMGLTPEEAVEFEGGKAGARETAKGASGRQQETINVGLRAAQQLPVLKRTRNLLDELETGGFEGTATRIRNALGIEGADERELTTNMARAVLSQLRDTFGAQFTEREGARLESIEASIGNSTEGNKRILDGLLKMTQFKADRAVKAAKATGDFSVIEEIESYMNLDMTPASQSPSSGKIKILSIE